ncbi:MAG: class II aldolase/adducin family protein [Deltaproteobacteria bacterium]|nr:class II aldolase/adducin family protein [Deltaproteobacteria bacterium]
MSVGRPNETLLRQQLAQACQRIWQRGWVANHDGNGSVRLSRERILCTPTAVSKADITPTNLLILGSGGRVLSGEGRPFSELALHIAYYQARPDVQVVLHCHSPYATALGLTGTDLGQPRLPEAVVSLGPFVPTVPLASPGQDAVHAIVPYLAAHDVLLLVGNGVLAVGDSVEQAYLRLELVEHLCRIEAASRQFGQPGELPASMVSGLLKARQRAGLGPEARGLIPPADAAAIGRQAGTERNGQDASALQALVRREVARVIKGG